MIDVIVFVKDGKYTGLKVSGHAEFEEEGKDIVCAAVSVLTMNLSNSLEQFCDDKFTVDCSDGLFCLVLHDRSEKSGVLLDSCILGLMDIGEGYSEFIKINLQEVK
jgi:ribosomal protein